MASRWASRHLVLYVCAACATSVSCALGMPLSSGISHVRNANSVRGARPRLGLDPDTSDELINKNVISRPPEQPPPSPPKARSASRKRPSDTAVIPLLIVSSHKPGFLDSDFIPQTAAELKMQLLRCKSEQDWEGAENGLWWAFDNKPELLEPVHFNVVISTLAATKPPEWERALVLLDQMPLAGLQPDSYSFSAAISACSRAGQTDRALAVFRQCVAQHEVGCAPNNVVFNAMLAACQRGGAPWRSQLLAVFASMSAHGVTPDAWAYSAAIDALAHTGQWERALGLLDDLEAAGSVSKPESYCYGAAMRACMRVGRWQAVIGLYERMVALNVPVTTHTLAPALSACGKVDPVDGWRRAEEILRTEEEAAEAEAAEAEAAKREATTPRRRTKDGSRVRGGGMGASPGDGVNVHCYTAIAQTYAHGGRWREATRLLETMRERSIVPNAHTYTAVLRSYGPSRQWRPALELLRSMRSEAGVRPDAHCAQEALRVIGRGGQPDVAVALVRGMRKELGVKPTAVHVTTAVGALVTAGRIEEASTFVAELLHLPDVSPPTSPHTQRALGRVRLDSGLCDVALGLCARLGDGARARQLVGRLAEDSAGRAQLTERMRECVAIATDTQGEDEAAV